MSTLKNEDMLLKAKRILSPCDYARFMNLLYKRKQKTLNTLLGEREQELRKEIAKGIDEGVNIDKSRTELELCKIMFRKVEEFINTPVVVV
jgi:hypothetical protein